MTISLSRNIVRTPTTVQSYTEMKPSIVELQQRLYEFYGNSNVRLTKYDILCLLTEKDPTAITVTINPTPSNAKVILKLEE